MIRVLLGTRDAVLKVATSFAWLPPTLARICLGWIFIESGWGKLRSLPKVVEFFALLGIPADRKTVLRERAALADRGGPPPDDLPGELVEAILASRRPRGLTLSISFEKGRKPPSTMGI